MTRRYAAKLATDMVAARERIATGEWELFDDFVDRVEALEAMIVAEDEADRGSSWQDDGDPKWIGRT